MCMYIFIADHLQMISQLVCFVRAEEPIFSTLRAQKDTYRPDHYANVMHVIEIR